MAKKKIKKDSEQEKQFNVVVWVMIVILIIIIGGVVYAIQSRTFNYHGIEFEKTAYGDIVLYTAKVPQLDEYGKVISEITVDFRNDPRNLEDVKIYSSGNLGFIPGQVWFSMNPEMESCEQNSIAMANFGLFVSKAGIPVKSAFTDADFAESKGYEGKTCADSELSTVITISDGNETAIREGEGNCYVLTYRNCEITKVTEKFQLQIIEQHIKELGK